MFKEGPIDPYALLTLDEIFSRSHYPTLVLAPSRAPWQSSDSSVSRQTSTFSVTRAVNALVPKALELWDEFSINASRFRGQIRAASYQPLRLDIDRKVWEKQNILSCWERVDERLSTMYHEQLSRDIRMMSSAMGADMNFYGKMNTTL